MVNVGVRVGVLMRVGVRVRVRGRVHACAFAGRWVLCGVLPAWCSSCQRRAVHIFHVEMMLLS